jgi:hypothetical protein
MIYFKVNIFKNHFFFPLRFFLATFINGFDGRLTSFGPIASNLSGCISLGCKSPSLTLFSSTGILYFANLFLICSISLNEASLYFSLECSLSIYERLFDYVLALLRSNIESPLE